MPRIRAGLAASTLLLGGLVAAAAPSASAAPGGRPMEIPIPTVTVTKQCGARNDIVRIDPKWLDRWGDKVTIFAPSLTFQGGKDGETAKPAGEINAKFRGKYSWAGSSERGWDRFILYPGTVAPVVDAAEPCAPAAAAALGR